MSLPDAPALTSSSTFDLDTYIGRYAPDSETRLQRLALLVQHSPSEQTKQAALQYLKKQVQQAGNVVRYSQVIPHDQQDQEWIRSATATNESSLEILEARLSQAQANLNKDAIRTCFLSLGEFHTKTGNLREALRHTMRARDYCTSRQQTGQICWQVILLSMNTGTVIRMKCDVM
jgi:COP9 signalosome complex subunit 1